MALNIAGPNGAGVGIDILDDTILDVYSDEILHFALGATRFEEFAVVREDLMLAPGQTLNFVRYNDLGGDPALPDEATAMTTDSMSSSTLSITVNEYGKAVKVSEKLLVVNRDDIMREASMQLGRHYSQWGPDRLLMLNALFGDGVSAPSVLYANDRAARTDLQANDFFDTELIREAVEELQVNNVPKFDNDFYICICHPHQARYIRQDPDWIAANNYHGTRALFNGELGRWEDVVFVQTSNLPNGTATSATEVAFYDGNADTFNDLTSGVAGNQTDVYTASLFGDGYYALAWALPVEMRHNGVEDFGRLHSLAWYAIYGAGLLHPTHGLRLESA